MEIKSTRLNPFPKDRDEVHLSSLCSLLSSGYAQLSVLVVQQEKKLSCHGNTPKCFVRAVIFHYFYRNGNTALHEAVQLGVTAPKYIEKLRK